MLRKTCKDVVLFPITIYRACLWLPIRLRGNRGHSCVNTALGLLLYGLIGLPLSILLLLEMLIVINTQLMAQPIDRLQPHSPLARQDTGGMALRPANHTARVCGQGIPTAGPDTAARTVL